MWLVGYVNVSHERYSNLNSSPKMSCGVLECDVVMLQNYAYAFVIKHFYVIKKGRYLCRAL